jgi:hypothetical protein
MTPVYLPYLLPYSTLPNEIPGESPEKREISRDSIKLPGSPCKIFTNLNFSGNSDADFLIIFINSLRDL